MCVALEDVPDLVCREIGPRFFGASQPMNFQAIHFCRRTKPDVYAMSVLRQIGRTAYGAAKFNSPPPSDHGRAVTKPDGSPARRNTVMQTNLHPIPLRTVVSQQPHSFAMVHDSHIHRAIIVEVGDRQSSAHMRLRERSIPRR